MTLLEYKSLSGNISTIGRGRFSAIVPYGSLKTIELKGLSQGPPYVQATFMTYKMLIHFTKVRVQRDTFEYILCILKFALRDIEWMIDSSAYAIQNK